MPKSPRERIQTLLQIHGGHCFIVSTCDGFEAIAAEVAKMEKRGLVKVSASTTVVTGLDVQLLARQ